MSGRDGTTNEEKIQKMLSQVEIRSEKECWTWKGKLINSGQRLRIPFLYLDGGQRTVSPMVIMYEKFIGEWPLHVASHRDCKNILCLNPHHLKLGRTMKLTKRQELRTNRPKSGDIDITLEEFTKLKDFIPESIAFFLNTDTEFVHRLYRRFNLKRNRFTKMREYDGPEPYTPKYSQSCDEGARFPCPYVRECEERFMNDEPLMCEATIYAIKEEREEHEKLTVKVRVGGNGYH